MDPQILFEIKKFPHGAVFFTDRKKVKDFDEIIKNLPKNSTIIIREYDLDEKSREEFAKKIVSLARPRALKILVGKSFALAKKINADGVHFSDFDKLPLQFFKKNSFKKGFIFSLSAHSLQSYLKLRRLRPDWLFISPIFPTSSHAGTKSLGLKNLAKISFKNRNCRYFPGPLFATLFALGGINSQNLKSVRKLGISGFGAIDLFSNNL